MALLTCLAVSDARPDGCYVSRTQSVAISADQRAIIIKNGDEVSMTFSTGYTGEGEDFGWIIPTPVVPAIEDVKEAGKAGIDAFTALDRATAPVLSIPSGGARSGCFPAGSEVLTVDGLRPIEHVDPGRKVHACDLATGKWVLATVLQRQTIRYAGDMITVRLGAVTLRATGNHPFFVRTGHGLASRPAALDVPEEERVASERGRWVSARDLRDGDMLAAESGGALPVTGLSSRQETADVYCLEIDRVHNCAMTSVGVLVHNSGKMEAKGPSSGGGEPVTVYGTISMEHYEASVLGAADSSALVDWLDRNGYTVNPAASSVLDSYIAQRWAFVAVKLKPNQKRHYRNEFLPPLTIAYRNEELIFPLRISSVSTAAAARITLYVVTVSTVSSTNYPTVDLPYEASLQGPVDAKSYIESRIQFTRERVGRALVRIWSGRFEAVAPLESLMRRRFPSGAKQYLTRLEARMDAAAMEDIAFMLHAQPREFRVSIEAR